MVIDNQCNLRSLKNILFSIEKPQYLESFGNKLCYSWIRFEVIFLTTIILYHTEFIIMVVGGPFFNALIKNRASAVKLKDYSL